MGRIIQKNNGKTTVFTTGENFNSLTPITNTYYVGVDLSSGYFEKLNPTGSIINLEDLGPSFTGGTVSGATNFTNGLSATTFSATTYLNLPIGIEVTYSELVDKITGSTLTIGTHYIITDFKTCYDQPNFDYNGNPITFGNYKVSNIEPIVVFATSANTISTTAYQPAYPNDTIKYDWTWDTTEVTNGVAYGRITERVDEFNNRTDYDHRNILFKRYQYIEIDMNNPLLGIVDVVATSSTEMSVTGTSTNFTSLSVGNYVGFGTVDNFKAYEVVSISGDTEMSISGLSSFNSSFIVMYNGNSQTDSSYYQNNITTAFTEYYTFDYNNTNINNYVGNYSNLSLWDGTSFILANNVFMGSSYVNNTFGDGCGNNTFDDDCTNNIIGNYFYNNITDDDFDGNIIGNYFRNNRITSNFQYNRIGENFQNNYIVQNSFYRNNIMNYFSDNIISGDNFQNNEIGSQFNNNILRNGQFYKNDIGNGYNYNNVYSEFYGNLIGNGYNNNNIYSQFYENTIGEIYENNTIGTNLTIGIYNFSDNKIGNQFTNNTCYGSFSYNTIGTNFSYNDVEDGFGFGGLTSQGNRIGNNFSSNQIGEYFYNNTISDNFTNNTVSNLFQWNIINTMVNSVCLSTGMLYDITTVNVFKNKNGDDRLSYYDELDVLTIETLTEAPCLGGLNALDIPENDLNFSLIL